MIISSFKKLLMTSEMLMMKSFMIHESILAQNSPRLAISKTEFNVNHFENCNVEEKPTTIFRFDNK